MKAILISMLSLGGTITMAYAIPAMKPDPRLENYILQQSNLMGVVRYCGEKEKFDTSIPRGMRSSIDGLQNSQWKSLIEQAEAVGRRGVVFIMDTKNAKAIASIPAITVEDIAKRDHTTRGRVCEHLSLGISWDDTP